MQAKFHHARRSLLAAALGAVLGAGPGFAHAQQNVIKMIVPFPAGGITDQAARIVAEQMSQRLGQPVIVDNRPGAGSRLGIDAVVKAPPDGNTLLFTNTSYSIYQVVNPKAGFDATRALAPVSLSATYSLQIVTSTRVPAATLPEFIAYAKKNPGKLSYGSAGIGSGSHFAGEFFKSLTGTYLVHIPYKSTTGALSDVAGGQLELAFDGSAKPLVDAGRVKLLAVTGDKRDPRFPNTPTAPEAGLKPFAMMQSWVGVLAPPATPQPVLEKLNKAAAAAVADAGVQKRFAQLGLRAQGGPASRLATAIADEVALHRKIAADAKLRFED
jgi:tripartite-type tricarboxylate transporter receptor subunit TctC